MPLAGGPHCSTVLKQRLEKRKVWTVDALSVYRSQPESYAHLGLFSVPQAWRRPAAATWLFWDVFRGPQATSLSKTHLTVPRVPSLK